MVILQVIIKQSKKPLVIVEEVLSKEAYGVGFRKGSDLANILNQFFKATYENGDMMKIAEQYGAQAAIIAQ